MTARQVFLVNLPFSYKMSFLAVTTSLGNPKGPVKPGNPNTCAEIKLRLFLFTSVLEIACRETEVLKTVSSG